MIKVMLLGCDEQWDEVEIIKWIKEYHSKAYARGRIMFDDSMFIANDQLVYLKHKKKQIEDSVVLYSNLEQL
jgi:hypothetical protein